jgi:methylphosphotriester-DNA--protein-cysteine methyltransferase
MYTNLNDSHEESRVYVYISKKDQKFDPFFFNVVAQHTIFCVFSLYLNNDRDNVDPFLT